MKVNIAKLSVLALVGLQVASAMAQTHFTERPTERIGKFIDKPIHEAIDAYGIRREIAQLESERRDLRKELSQLEEWEPIRPVIRVKERREVHEHISKRERIASLRAEIARIDTRIMLLEARLPKAKEKCDPRRDAICDFGAGRHIRVTPDIKNPSPRPERRGY